MKTTSLSAAIALAVFSTGAYAYTPGTYTAAIAGQNGPVKVEVTTSADKILSVKIVDKKKLKVSGPRQLQHFRPKSLKRSLPMFKALQVRLSLLPLLRKLFKNA